MHFLTFPKSRYSIAHKPLRRANLSALPVFHPHAAPITLSPRINTEGQFSLLVYAFSCSL